MLSQTKNVFVTHSRLLTELERNRKPFLSVVMACVLKLFAVTNGSVFSLHLNSRRRFHRRFNTQTLVKILLFLQLFLKHIKHKTLGTFIAPTHLWLMLIMAKPLDVYLYPITIWYSHLLPLIQHETPIITH